MVLLWLGNWEKKSWKDPNQKIALIRIEIMKTGANIKYKKITRWIFSENQKSNISAIQMFVT